MEKRLINLFLSFFLCVRVRVFVRSFLSEILKSQIFFHANCLHTLFEVRVWCQNMTQHNKWFVESSVSRLSYQSIIDFFSDFRTLGTVKMSKRVSHSKPRVAVRIRRGSVYHYPYMKKQSYCRRLIGLFLCGVMGTLRWRNGQ